jgi:hypothetical protein
MVTTIATTAMTAAPVKIQKPYIENLLPGLDGGTMPPTRLGRHA